MGERVDAASSRSRALQATVRNLVGLVRGQYEEAEREAGASDTWESPMPDWSMEVQIPGRPETYRVTVEEDA